MKAFFIDKFEYNHHYNQLIADIMLKHSGKLSERSIKLFSHILNAHQIWNTRIDPVEKPFDVWKIHPIENFHSIDKSNFEQSLRILNTKDLGSTIRYQNSAGATFQNTLHDIMYHTLNHGTYHRGQLATEFRALGIEPIKTDYIFYKRN